MSTAKTTLIASCAVTAILLVCTACTSQPPQNGMTGGSDNNAAPIENTSSSAARLQTAPASAERVNLADSYDKLSQDNVFRVVSFDEMKKICEHGTGVLMFGFSSCPACTEYVPMLDALAKEHGLEEISYYDLEPDRDAQNDQYKEVLSLMSGHTRYNKDGEERLFVPAVAFIDAGQIIFYDDETCELGPNDPSPAEYWDDRRLTAWKDRMGQALDDIKVKMEECGECGAE